MNRLTRLALTGLWLSACTAMQPVDPNDDAPGAPFDPIAALPFDPADPAASFTARLVIEDRDGNHPAATLTFDGATYTTDANGVIVIDNVKVRGTSSARLTANGFMPRAVRLSFQDVGSEAGFRVVLEDTGVAETLDAATGGSFDHGPMAITLAGSSFRTKSGGAYNGQVHVNALGFDPVASVLQLSMDGPSMRADFDPARIPQGFSVAVDASSQTHFLLPESVFQVELTDDNGDGLSLDASAPATFRFRLSTITTRAAGDVLPTYTFDEAAQLWVQDGTCTVQKIADSEDLECVGTTTHFSTWMIASGKDTTKPACGNLAFRVGTANGKYPTKVMLGDRQVGTNPESVKIVKAYGRGSDTEAPSNVDTGAAELNLTKTCFVQADSYAHIIVHATMLRVENGGVVREVVPFVIGKSNSSTASYYDRNLPLVTTTVKDPRVNVNSLEEACGVCPTTYIDLDPSNAVAQSPESVSLCVGLKELPGATCVPATGKYKCNDSTQEFTDNVGCAAPKPCPTGQAREGRDCQPVNECTKGTATCGDHSTCQDLPVLYTCVCDSNYTKDANGVCQQNALDSDCDGTDDNANGSIDEDFMGTSRTCVSTSSGLCSAQVSVCASGLESCPANFVAQIGTDTTCDGRDNDCNDAIDDGYVSTGIDCASDIDSSCSTQSSECSSGSVWCPSGYHLPDATDTDCDGIDDNCRDGPDDMFAGMPRQCLLIATGACTMPNAVCTAGTVGCPDGYLEETADEVGLCGDTADNDCDGLTDSEDPDCMVCVPTDTSDPTCDNVDDDCDMDFDEDYVASAAACVPATGTCVDPECVGGGEQCPGGTTPQAPFETLCTDFADDDCDGLIDSADSDCAPPPSCTGMGDCLNVPGCAEQAICLACGVPDCLPQCEGFGICP